MLQLKSLKRLISAHVFQENRGNTVLKQQYVLHNFMFSWSNCVVLNEENVEYESLTIFHSAKKWVGGAIIRGTAIFGG